MTSTSETEPSPRNPTAYDASTLDHALTDLKRGAKRLQAMPLAECCSLLDACAALIVQHADEWIRVSCSAKRIAVDQPIAAEEILAGPASLLRYLRLVTGVFRDLQASGVPRLPAAPRTNTLGRLCVPVLPIDDLYDRLIFKGLQAEVWLQPEADRQSMFSDAWETRAARSPRVACVLGAGNVSAIPATDALYKIFYEFEAVLLKLNPVNEYLEPVFSKIFGPLISADLLRIVRGGRDVGDAIVQHPAIDALHLTGSHRTHEAIVWGADPQQRVQRQRDNEPLVTKAITSELGNVTPWVIVPGEYSQRQLRAQAENLVASIVANASFNCVATKLIVTSSGWPQRQEFLDHIDALLQQIPPRYAYYPGSRERFERAAGFLPFDEEGTLPWTLIRDAKPDQSPHLFDEESFVCVCAETQLEESQPERFLDQAVAFVNDQVFGTLCCSLTLPDAWRKQHRDDLERAIDRLRYGSVCLNQWAGIVYGLMTPPWGGHHSASLASPDSGLGHVHNTFGLAHVDKTVLLGPLSSVPKPVWFPTHRTADRLARRLIRFYEKPGPLRLPPIFYHALRG
ncbi:Aldehyde dehydrogenase family protein [Rosistilla carotiformis]|uniref:Aldehyde dehydrogenase family protein n=1 Tax=Rosistilla carotiformis TaxID=2528017 RepID=A0A518JSU8_9BACT|nr:aldehyde dehydrogenase family protein [Rosistilla carotiformis]QDV68610.1 Aldehyde dehydrogenase family protein [Rosistilla carotiformis]